MKRYSVVAMVALTVAWMARLAAAAPYNFSASDFLTHPAKTDPATWTRTTDTSVTVSKQGTDAKTHKPYTVAATFSWRIPTSMDEGGTIEPWVQVQQTQNDGPYGANIEVIMTPLNDSKQAVKGPVASTSKLKPVDRVEATKGMAVPQYAGKPMVIRIFCNVGADSYTVRMLYPNAAASPSPGG